MPSLRKVLFRTYWKAEAAIVPHLRSSQYAYYEKLRSVTPGKEWLDLGCGHQVFADWMSKEQSEVISKCGAIYGIDLDWAGLKAHPEISRRVLGDLTRLPFKNSSFDVVSANMVAEHLNNPETVLREVHRVLRPGGRFVFHTPNYRAWVIQTASRIPESIKKKLIWLLEGRSEEDVFRTYYRMNTEPAIVELAASTDFRVEEIAMVSSTAATVMLGPLAWVELFYIRYLQNPKRAKFRSNIVATLRK